METRKASTYSIDAADRTLRLLTMLSESDRITVTDAGRRLGVTRSTAFRFLNVLQQRDFVSQDPETKAYLAGPALLRVGLATMHRSDLRTDVRPLLERLNGAFDETVHLLILQGSQSFFLDSVESKRVVRAVSRVGVGLPANCTSGGKVLLAALPPATVDALFAGDLTGITPHSVTSLKRLKRELATARKLGWAPNEEESEDGLRAVAIPIPPGISSSTIPAAITISGPSERFDKERMREIADQAIAIAAQMAGGGAFWQNDDQAGK